MGILSIKHTDLPEIIESMLEMINNGSWYLYRIVSYNDATYILKADGLYYLLSNTGKVLDILPEMPAGVQIQDSVFFSDIKMPLSSDALLSRLSTVYTYFKGESLIHSMGNLLSSEKGKRQYDAIDKIKLNFRMAQYFPHF